MPQERISVSALRIAIRTFYSYQLMRVNIANRLKEKKDGSSQKIPENQNYKEMVDIDRQMLKDILENTEQQEYRLGNWIEKRIKDYPIYNWLISVKGIGWTMAAVIISSYDIYKADTISKLWQFTGLNPGLVKGKKWNSTKTKILLTDDMIRGDKLTPGYLSPYNSWLRTKMCGVLGASFIKANSPYRKYYDDMKQRYENEDGWKETTQKHRHNAAVRYMIKMFLSDLYVNWRTVEGLPVRPPYQEEYLGHTHSKDVVNSKEINNTTNLALE